MAALAVLELLFQQSYRGDFTSASKEQAKRISFPTRGRRRIRWKAQAEEAAVKVLLLNLDAEWPGAWRRTARDPRRGASDHSEHRTSAV
jgi:hypothetical protein